MLARQSFSESYKVLQMDMYDMCDNLPLFKATISPGSARSICHSATSWAGARPVVEQWLNLQSYKGQHWPWNYTTIPHLSDDHNGTWMLGRTPPWAMVTPAISLFNSSSFLNIFIKNFHSIDWIWLNLIASCRCLGMILVFLLSLAALPASSRISAARYSITAAKYTGAPAPTLLA